MFRLRLERVTELSLAYHDVAAAPEGTRVRGEVARRVRRLAKRTVAERQALAEIEAALDRLETGTYGLCEQCREPISSALLATHPQARYCAACDQPTSRTTP